MIIYQQSTGQLWSKDGYKLCIGYSGYGKGKNAPIMEAVKGVGPIPRGIYVIGEPYDSEKVGPFALPLIPTGHNALLRSDFRIHGDSSKHPGEASNGCIIAPREIRERIHNENDRVLMVVE